MAQINEKNKSTMKKQFLTVVLISFLLPVLYATLMPLYQSARPRNIPDMSGAPTYNNTLYITPIFESMSPSHHAQDLIEIADMKEKMGPSGDYIKIGFSVSCWYSATISNASGTWEFEPSDLNYKLQLAAETNTPILFHMNGGNWGACGMSNQLLRDLWYNETNCQWDQFNNVPKANLSENCLKDRLMSVSKYTPFNMFREKFCRNASSIIANWSKTYPDLFVGCSLDSEIHLDSGRVNGTSLYYDYNPLVIQEYREWLQTRCGTVENYSSTYGQKVNGFAEIDAPREFKKGDKLWELWTTFRHYLVQEAVGLQSKWITESGIPRYKVYAHQILSEPGNEGANYGRCDTLETALNPYGVAGYTRYDFIDPETIWSINEVAGADWGLFEWNLWSEHAYKLYMIQLKLFYLGGIHTICPNGWHEFWNHGLMIKFDTEFCGAVKDFVAKTKDYPRTTAPFAQLTWDEWMYCNVRVNSNLFDRWVWLLAIPFVVSIGIITIPKVLEKRKIPKEEKKSVK